MITAQHHIKIITQEGLEKSQLKQWFKAVKEGAPEGTVTTVQTMKEGVGPINAQLIHNTVDGEHHYTIPLSRNLIDEEVNPIFELFSNVYTEGDFDIMISGDESPCTDCETVSIEVENDDYERLCEKLSKAMHQRWYEDKVDSGWRYAVDLNESDKTSPLLRPWDDLPEAYRDIDYTLPETLMNVFEEEGMVLVDKVELDKLLK